MQYQHSVVYRRLVWGLLAVVIAFLVIPAIGISCTQQKAHGHFDHIEL